MQNVSLNRSSKEFKVVPKPIPPGVEYSDHSLSVAKETIATEGFEGVVLFEKTEVSVPGDRPDRRVWVVCNPSSDIVPDCKDKADKNLKFTMAVGVIGGKLRWESWAFTPNYAGSKCYKDRAITEEDLEQ